MLNIYVNTWGNYNEHGADGGEWLTLPMDADELADALARIAERMGDEDPEWAIHDYEWAEDFRVEISEMANIAELNELTQQLADLSAYDLAKLEAMIDAFGYDIADGLDHLDDYTLYEGMTLHDVAEKLVNDCYDLPEFALRYFDYDAFARDLSFDGYTETDYGVIAG